MSEEKIPTAEEFFKKYSNLLQFEEGDPEYLVDKEDFETSMIEFAKLHVEATLKAASENVRLINDPDSFGEWPIDQVIDHQSILTAYPPENIK